MKIRVSETIVIFLIISTVREKLVPFHRHDAVESKYSCMKRLRYGTGLEVLGNHVEVHGGTGSKYFSHYKIEDNF